MGRGNLLTEPVTWYSRQILDQLVAEHYDHLVKVANVKVRRLRLVELDGHDLLHATLAHLWVSQPDGVEFKCRPRVYFYTLIRNMAGNLSDYHSLRRTEPLPDE